MVLRTFLRTFLNQSKNIFEMLAINLRLHCLCIFVILRIMCTMHAQDYTFFIALKLYTAVKLIIIN